MIRTLSSILLASTLYATACTSPQEQPRHEPQVAHVKSSTISESDSELVARKLKEIDEGNFEYSDGQVLIDLLRGEKQKEKQDEQQALKTPLPSIDVLKAVEFTKKHIDTDIDPFDYSSLLSESAYKVPETIKTLRWVINNDALSLNQRLATVDALALKKAGYESCSKKDQETFYSQWQSRLQIATRSYQKLCDLNKTDINILEKVIGAASAVAYTKENKDFHNETAKYLVNLLPKIKPKQEPFVDIQQKTIACGIAAYITNVWGCGLDISSFEKTFKQVLGYSVDEYKQGKAFSEDEADMIGWDEIPLDSGKMHRAKELIERMNSGSD